MVPLRVVPFRVICLLGMDEAAFPRRDPGGLDPLTRDARANKRQLGDRSVREDDRLLFLQLIVAARDTLYMSWIGRDAHSNEVLAPSVVVAELMDNLREGYLALPADGATRAAQDALLPRVQPLHPFDASLFDADAPRSYRSEWLAAASAAETQGADAPFAPDAPLPQVEAVQSTRLVLDELRRFLLDPARAFLEQGLGLMLPREERNDADDEPLSPTDGLTRWSLTRALLDFGEGNASASRDILRARGQLPPGALGDEALRDARVRADALRSGVRAFTGGAAPLPAENLRVDWSDGARLEGAPSVPYPGGVLHVRPGEIDGRHVLRAWLDALLCAAAGLEKPVMLVGLDGNDACSFELPRLDREEARGNLLALMELYHRGRRAPLPFFVRTSWDHALTCAEAGGAFDTAEVPIGNDTFEKAARQAASENGFGGYNEFESDTVCIAWRGRDLPGPWDGELARSLHRTALAVFAHPARAWVEQFG
jgi:exodeoxyribonuclease V gamma subunit